MSDCMVSLDGASTGAVNIHSHSSANRGSLCLGRRARAVVVEKMQPGTAGFLSVHHAPEFAAQSKLAGIAYLAAHLGIKWREVEDNRGLFLHPDEFEDAGGSGQ